MNVKKALALLAAFVLVAAYVPMASAQFSPMAKGNWTLSGSLSFANYGGDLYKDAEGNSETQFVLSPSFGYFFSKGLLLGVNFEYEKDSQGDIGASTVSIGPAAEYYFALGREGKGAMYPLVGATFLYQMLSIDTGEEDQVKMRGTAIGFYGGGIYMLSNAVGVFGVLRFETHNQKMTEPIETDSQSGSVFGVFTGVKYFIF